MRLSIHRTFISYIKNWWWFAVAALLSLLVVGVSFVGGIVQNADYTLPQRLRVSIMIIGLLALWGLALQKPILEQDFWRLFFFFSLMVYVVLMIFENRYELPYLWRVISYVIFVSIHVPCYMGMFIYGFCSKQIWKVPQDERIAPCMKFPHYKWVRRTKWFKKWLGFVKLPATVVLIILCLTFIPLIIRNNRVLNTQGNPPEFYERMLKYRRTTIPQLHEFERLFPNYLCEFNYSESSFIIDPRGTGENIAYLDPNSPVRWRLSAGLHKRYLFVMEIGIVFAKIDPETGKLLSPGSHKQPAFTLWEVSSVWAPLVLFDQRRTWASREKIQTFGVDEWQRLVQAEGDFTALGMQLRHDAPIPNFELAFRNNY